MTCWQKRLQGLRQRLRKEGLGALVVSHLPNIVYLANFHGSAGVLVVTGGQAVLFTDGRYREEARRHVRGARVVVGSASPLASATAWLRTARMERIGYEAAHLPVAAFRRLRKGSRPRARLVATTHLVESLRAVKDSGEIAAIRGAVQLTAQVFAEVLPLVRPGVRELELAAEIEYRMRCAGAAGPAFETIVASGPRSAWPHARASPKRLARNELVVFDLGAILRGYCSDMTRTIYLGRPTARVRRLYAAVREAQERALDAVRPGVPARRVDAVARQTLEAHGLGSNFVHSTGHGLGLEIHEEPRLARESATKLASGHVVTIEPGVYVAGWGGIRIEDVVVVRRTGAERVTPTPSTLIAL